MKNKQQQIAIIDDDDVLRRGLRVVFVKHEFDVVTFADGRTVTENVLDEMPDVVLCDYKLPVKNGFEILLEIRKLDKTIPFFLMTGYYKTELELEAIDFGATGVFEKPLNMKKIIDVCNRAVQKEVYVMGIKE